MTPMQQPMDGQGDSREPLLEIRELHVAFRERVGTVLAVRGVSLRIGAGESVGIVGESGCGKTVTALAVLGLLPESATVSGEVWLDGTDLTKAPEQALRAVRGHQISMVFQDPLASLNPVMTVGAQIMEVLAAHLDMPRSERADRARDLLAMVDIPGPAERFKAYPHELSGGMRQRVMIAIALACRPRLLIADEPTTALDVTVQAQLLETLDRLRTELGMALLLVSHDLGVVARACSRVAVMYGGRIVEVAQMRHLLAAQQHPYTAALLAAAPKLSGPTRTGLHTIGGMPPPPQGGHRGVRLCPALRAGNNVVPQRDPALAETAPDRAVACFFPTPVEPQ